jgi:hypothetical protein
MTLVLVLAEWLWRPMCSKTTYDVPVILDRWFSVKFWNTACKTIKLQTNLSAMLNLFIVPFLPKTVRSYSYDSCVLASMAGDFDTITHASRGKGFLR